MSIQKSGNVGIFWDYENCPTPASTSGYAIANSISALARPFGCVNVFKAYLEISDQNKVISLRSELQSSGVSLVDCPHNGRKDVADKMLLVDMLSYAIDNPAPSTIFLITADRDFAYALSVLKNRQYRVVLVTKRKAHVSLTFQACICFDWLDDVVHRAENEIPTSQSEQRAPRQLHRKDSDSVGNAPVSRPSPHPVTDDCIDSGLDTDGPVDIIPFLQDRISERESSVSQKHTQVIITSNHESPRQDREISSSPRQRGEQSFSTSRDSASKTPLMQQKPQCSQSDSPYTLLPGSTFPRHNPPLVKWESSIEPTHSTLVFGSGCGGGTRQTGSFPESRKDAVLSSISPFSSPIISPSLVATTNSTVAQHEKTKSAKVTVSSAVPPMIVEELPKRFLKEQTNNTSPTSPPSSINRAIGFQVVAVPPKQSASTATTADAVKPGIKISVTPESMNARPANPISGKGSGQSAVPLETPTVPPHFEVLVETLQWERSKGVLRPYRSEIAERISKKRTTYRNAGVTSFRKYSLLAEQAGIVEMGGNGGSAWISLMPKWQNVHIMEPNSSPMSEKPKKTFGTYK